MSQPHFLTITQAARLVRSRALSPVELTEALLARIQALDPQVNAFITLTADLALKQARQAERGNLGNGSTVREPLNNCHREEQCDEAISYLVDLTNCEIASLRSQRQPAGLIRGSLVLLRQ